MKQILLIILIVGSALTAPVISSGQSYVPGTTYWGRNNYIEYVAGDLPIIISAPHGGYLQPAEIPNRKRGIKHPDYRSQEYAREVAAYLTQLTGKQPHLIINHLHRIKLDANRSLKEAAEGNQWAEQAWYEFHHFIEAAKVTITAQCGKGGYFDFHTGSHANQVIVELGFGLSPGVLGRTDEQLNHSEYKDKSTVRSLAYTPGLYFPEIIRRQTSLGGLLQARGFAAIPSPDHPDPDGVDHFFSGYNIELHGSKKGGSIDGIQVETASDLLHDRVRAAYSLALAQSINDIYEMHYKCPDPSLPHVYNVYFPILIRY